MATLLPFAASSAAAMEVNGGAITTSQCFASAIRGKNSAKNSRVSAWVLYIFQLPAITLRREWELIDWSAPLRRVICGRPRIPAKRLHRWRRFAGILGRPQITRRRGADQSMSSHSRRRVMAGNWKMYKTQAETREFFAEFLPLIADAKHCDVVIAPPFTSIAAALEAAKGSKVAIAGQNNHWQKEGAFTGEVSPPMLVEAGCTYVIVGHSERRQYSGETDDMVGQKSRAALAVGLTPIVCLGENFTERETGKTEEILSQQFIGGPGDKLLGKNFF